MAELPPWPDPHYLLMQVFENEPRLTVSPVVGPLLYVDFQDDMPLIRVRKTGGNNDHITDFPRMAVDVYAPTYTESRDLAEAVRQRLMAYPHFTPSAGRLDRCEVEISPFEVPWPDTTLRYHTAVYQLSTRR